MEDNILNTILPKIKKIREIKGFSQEYIASKLEITQNTYSKIERGETKITLDKLNDICKALEISLDLLFNFNDRMVFNNCNQTGNFGEYSTYVFNSIDKISELYERIIDSKNNEIERLQKIIKSNEQNNK